jgi:type II secretory pathway pseudopilin PulG
VSRMRRLRRRLGGAGGYMLTELLVTMSILSIVLAGLTQLFASGIRAESDVALRHQAQAEARNAMSYLRREAHCANAASVTTTGITPNQVQALSVTLPSGCPTGTGQVTWCTVFVASYHFQLYRKAGATCDTTGKRYADYLTSGLAFTYTAPSAASLGSIGVSFPVDPNSSSVSPNIYRLTDDLVLRNTIRA